MNYQIISMAFLMMIGLACEMALEEMLGLNNMEKRWQRRLMWCTGFLVISFSVIFQSVIGIAMLIPIVYWGRRLYMDIDKAAKAVIQVLTSVLSFVLAYPITYLIVGHRMSFDFAHYDMILITVLGVTIAYSSIYIAMNRWNRKYNGYVKKSNIWIFMLILASEIAGVNRTIHMPDIEQAVRILVIQCFIDIGIFLIMYNLVSKERMENELKQLKYYMEREREYYQELDKEREEMAKLRHDYNNQLTSVLGLIHMNRLDEAKEMLKEMGDKAYD